MGYAVGCEGVPDLVEGRWRLLPSSHLARGGKSTNRRSAKPGLCGRASELYKACPPIHTRVKFARSNFGPHALEEYSTLRLDKPCSTERIRSPRVRPRSTCVRPSSSRGDRLRSVRRAPLVRPKPLPPHRRAHPAASHVRLHVSSSFVAPVRELRRHKVPSGETKGARRR